MQSEEVRDYAKDEIARLKFEARRFRDLAKARRADIAALRARPIGSRDPIAELRARDRVSEYTRAAKECDRRIALLRAGARTVAEIQAEARAKVAA